MQLNSKSFLLFSITCILISISCNHQKRDKVKILHASTLYERGNYLELFDDSTYTVTCFLFDSSSGKYSLRGDTIYLEPSNERCDLKAGKLLLTYNDSIAQTLPKSKPFLQKTNDSLPQGYLFELNSNNIVEDKYYVYHILMDSMKVK